MAPVLQRLLQRAIGLTIYVSIVVLAGTGATAGSLYVLSLEPVGLQWFALLALTVVSATAVLKIPGIPANFTISDTFTITAAVLYGPAAGTTIVALDGLYISYWLSRAGLPPRRLVFNATAPALAMWLAAHLLPSPMGSPSVTNTPLHLLSFVLPLAIFAAVYFVLNTGAIAIAVALEKQLSPLAVWRTHFLGLWLTYFSGGAAAGLVVLLVYTTTSSLALLAVLVPLPMVLYVAFKHAMGRLDDQLRHLADLNALYLSTIEALAQAIDAKDHFTHGHIRRVQMYGVRLARELGVKNEAELKAIEAAALLHDMGKIGVPEHILNKPGKLTAAEYEKVKLHASLGADILSSLVVYLADGSGDTLKVAFAAGEHRSVLSQVAVPLGRRLSGWVAANRSTMVNADALLDLADVSAGLNPPLHTSLSSPIVADGRTLGALTLYSSATSAFADPDGRLLEAFAAGAAVALGRIQSRAAA